MALELIKVEVGPWPMNCYIMSCNDSKECAIIDPGADVKKILNVIEGYDVKFILVTHGHGDHIGALKEVSDKTNAQICSHPMEAARFKIDIEVELRDKDEVIIGANAVKIYHIPGHTEGHLCFDLQDGRILVGDVVFVGGPGKTWSAEDFETTMSNMQNLVFKWPDDTKFYPGHGPAGIIGKERPAFEKFVQTGWKKGLFGDVGW